MEADRLTQIEAAYHTARDRRGEDRSRFLDEVCGADIAMRRQIDALLRQDSSANSLLDRPAIEAVVQSTSADCVRDLRGTHIGVYEVLERIDSGGMGDIYRARDTRLHRDAAMKFLPSHLAGDPERLSRLRREAQTLAALSHPNIAQVYGLEESSGTTAIAMEFVEGETLAQRLRRGPLDVRNAVRIGREIAEALEAAHEKGIVHRDLKPANVKLTPQGQVKVLDFGLAKAFRSPRPLAAVASAPSDRNPVTSDGMILGTRGYMSPEQAAGAPTDHRTDVFSFGCVLYEMLTGTKAFDGNAPPAEPSAPNIGPDLAKLPHGITPRIRNLVARCLEQEPRRRWQAIGDVRIELEEIQTDPFGLETRSWPANDKPLWKRALPLVATAIVTGAFVAFLIGGRPAPPQQTKRLSVDLAAEQAFSEHGRHIVDVSRDGSLIAFIANDQLMVRNLADTAPRPLPVRGWDLSNPFFSPDGRWVAFFADRKLQKIASSGGKPAVICDLGGITGLFGASWERDDVIFLGRGPRGIQRVSAKGGEPPETVLTVNAGEVAHRPQLLPDGEHVLYTLAPDEPGERWDHAQIVVQSLKSGARRVVIQSGSDARYVASSGRIIYAQGSTLWTVAFDATRLQAIGDPISIVEGVRRASLDVASGAAQFGVSANGMLAYISGGVPSPTRRPLVQIDMTGRTTVLDVQPGLNHTPRFSFGGTQIAWQGGDGNIWIYDRGGRRATRKLTFNGTSSAPVWTPNDRIVFRSGRDGDFALFWQPADGTASAERLLAADPGFSDIPTSVSPDGGTLLFQKTRDPAPRDQSKGSDREGIWMLPLAGPKVPRRLIGPGHGRRESHYGAAAFSPNGRWIVYKAQPGSVTYVEPFPPTGSFHQVTSGQNWAPMWAPHGDRLIFLGGGRNRFFAVDILRQDARFDYGPPRHLFDVQTPVNTFGDGGRIADLSPDGKHVVAFLGELDAPPPSKIDVVLGWTADLQPRQARGY